MSICGVVYLDLISRGVGVEKGRKLTPFLAVFLSATSTMEHCLLML